MARRKIAEPETTPQDPFADGLAEETQLTPPLLPHLPKSYAGAVLPPQIAPPPGPAPKSFKALMSQVRVGGVDAEDSWQVIPDDTAVEAEVMQCLLQQHPESKDWQLKLQLSVCWPVEFVNVLIFDTVTIPEEQRQGNNIKRFGNIQKRFKSFAAACEKLDKGNDRCTAESPAAFEGECVGFKIRNKDTVGEDGRKRTFSNVGFLYHLATNTPGLSGNSSDTA